MSAWVYFLGSYISLEGPSGYTIGRGRECEIQLPDISVSRRHARIIRETDGYIIEDLNSTNGTLVNGEPVTRRALKSGDQIRVGRLHLEFQNREDDATPATLDPGDTIVLEGEIARLVGEVNDPEIARRIAGLQEFVSRSKRRLSELTFRDHLTGLYNRRSFDARLRDEVERVRRYTRPFCLLMIDIDHFKACNDAHGHQKGDDVLRGVGRIIVSSVRRSDFTARYGGEEIAVILPETGAQQGMQVAEKVRRGVEELSEAYTGLLVTVSIGGASCNAADCDGAALLQTADAALYEAKEGGRNRIVMH
ncbi:MAG: diguanylate cyclase [Spirochaetaceae bacterium]